MDLPFEKDAWQKPQRLRIWERRGGGEQRPSSELFPGYSEDGGELLLLGKTGGINWSFRLGAEWPNPRGFLALPALVFCFEDF